MGQCIASGYWRTYTGNYYTAVIAFYVASVLVDAEFFEMGQCRRCPSAMMKLISEKFRNL